MKTIHVRIYRKYLKLEIDTETRKAAFFQINDKNQEARNEAQIGNEFSDVMYFERACQQGLDDLVDVLHKFVTMVTVPDDDTEEKIATLKPVSESEEEDGDYGSDKISREKADGVSTRDVLWVISLKFDGRRNIISDALASACHKYMAYTMLYRWAVMTMPELAGEYEEQKNETQLEIQRIVYRKEPPRLE